MVAGVMLGPGADARPESLEPDFVERARAAGAAPDAVVAEFGDEAKHVFAGHVGLAGVRGARVAAAGAAASTAAAGPLPASPPAAAAAPSRSIAARAGGASGVLLRGVPVMAGRRGVLSVGPLLGGACRRG